MIAKFIQFNQIMGSIDNELEKQKADMDWYKFKVKQISARFTPKPV